MIYNVDSVELSITAADFYLRKCFELEVSHKSQLFLADITNPTGYCSNLGT